MEKKFSIDDWPATAKKAAQEMKAKYGEPQGVTPTRLVWTNAAPFKEIIVTKEEHQHDFPKPHKDCLEHVVEYAVPAEKASALTESDGSLSYNRTAGTLSARCDSEAHNIGSLNLAVDIVTGKKDVEQARQAHADAIRQELAGQTPALAERLTFQTKRGSGDPDVTMVRPEAAKGRPPAQQPGQAGAP